MEKKVRGGLKSHISRSPIDSYLMENGLREPDVLVEIRKATFDSSDQPYMLTDAMQVQFMRMMMASINAKKFIEVGFFTGYNAASIALALPEDGKVIGCDVSEDYPNIGKPYWVKAGLEKKIQLEIRPASETLNNLIKNGESGTFDGVYVDADKTGYDGYYEACLKLVRPNGFIFLDNMFQNGGVLLPYAEQNDECQHIAALTKKIKKDTRVDSALLSIGDGLLMCRKL